MNTMSTMLLLESFKVLLIFALAVALAVAAIRLMWIAGSYLKRKSPQLP